LPVKAPAGEKNLRSCESEWVVQGRHMLRAILRECSYLPDLNSRQYLAKHALARFRVYRMRKGKTYDTAECQARLRQQHHEARKALNHLRRANEGEAEPLLRTLTLTYGRVGKRRHELMEPLLRSKEQGGLSAPMREGEEEEEDTQSADGESAPVASSSVASEVEDVTTGRRRNMKPLPELTPQLRALVLSQLDASPPATSRPELKPRSLKPEIPELNSWMRPMPKVRVANMTRRWYAEVLDRVLPPLPRQEWIMLRDLATGRTKSCLPPPRRKAAAVRLQASESGVSEALKDLVLFNRISHPPAPDRDIHGVTHRFMRRMYAKIFAECPLMVWDSSKNEWKITWGHHAMVPGNARLEGSKRT
jgi:hypothetical protein